MKLVFRRTTAWVLVYCLTAATEVGHTQVPPVEPRRASSEAQAEHPQKPKDPILAEVPMQTPSAFLAQQLLIDPDQAEVLMTQLSARYDSLAAGDATTPLSDEQYEADMQAREDDEHERAERERLAPVERADLAYEKVLAEYQRLMATPDAPEVREAQQQFGEAMEAYYQFDSDLSRTGERNLLVQKQAVLLEQLEVLERDRQKARADAEEIVPKLKRAIVRFDQYLEEVSRNKGDEYVKENIENNSLNHIDSETGAKMSLRLIDGIPCYRARIGTNVWFFVDTAQVPRGSKHLNQYIARMLIEAYPRVKEFGYFRTTKENPFMDEKLMEAGVDVNLVLTDGADILTAAKHTPEKLTRPSWPQPNWFRQFARAKVKMPDLNDFISGMIFGPGVQGSATYLLSGKSLFLFTCLYGGVLGIGNPTYRNIVVNGPSKWSRFKWANLMTLGYSVPAAVIMGDWSTGVALTILFNVLIKNSMRDDSSGIYRIRTAAGLNRGRFYWRVPFTNFIFSPTRANFEYQSVYSLFWFGYLLPIYFATEMAGSNPFKFGPTGINLPVIEVMMMLGAMYTNMKYSGKVAANLANDEHLRVHAKEIAEVANHFRQRYEKSGLVVAGRSVREWARSRYNTEPAWRNVVLNGAQTSPGPTDLTLGDVTDYWGAVARKSKDSAMTGVKSMCSFVVKQAQKLKKPAPTQAADPTPSAPASPPTQNSPPVKTSSLASSTRTAA